MGIADKVEAEIDSLAYAARECIGSGRKRLQIFGSDYCCLSGNCTGAGPAYCPLQEQREADGKLVRCLNADYQLELIERGNKIKYEK